MDTDRVRYFFPAWIFFLAGGLGDKQYEDGAFRFGI
jgi:hypothetical protein